METAQHIVAVAHVAVLVVERWLDKGRADGHAAALVAVVDVVVVVVVGTRRVAGDGRAGMVVGCPVDGAALVGEVDVFNDSAWNQRKPARIAVFQSPQAVKAVHLADARAVFPQPLGVGTQGAVVGHFVLQRDVPGAQVVALDKRVARAVAAAAGDKGAEEGLGVGIHLDGACHLAVLIVLGIAAKLAGRLGTDGEHDGLIGVGAEVQALVMQPWVRGDEVVIVVVMVLEPLVVQLAEVAELALDLHPPAGERDVLEVDETGTQAHGRARIVAPHEVTAAQRGVDDGWGFIRLSRHGKNAAVLGREIGFLNPCPGRMLLLHLKLAIAHMALIARAGGVTGPGSEPRAPWEALSLVDVVPQRGWRHRAEYCWVMMPPQLELM